MFQAPQSLSRSKGCVFDLRVFERTTAEIYSENTTKSGFNLPRVRSKVTSGSNRKYKRILERILI